MSVRRRSEEPAAWPFESLERLTAERLLVRHPQWEGELGRSNVTTYGARSFVDARVARFGGEPLKVVAVHLPGGVPSSSPQRDG